MRRGRSRRWCHVTSRSDDQKVKPRHQFENAGLGSLSVGVVQRLYPQRVSLASEFVVHFGPTIKLSWISWEDNKLIKLLLLGEGIRSVCSWTLTWNLPTLCSNLSLVELFMHNIFKTNIISPICERCNKQNDIQNTCSLNEDVVNIVISYESLTWLYYERSEQANARFYPFQL